MAFKPAYPHLMQTVTLPEGATIGSPAAGRVVGLSGGYVKPMGTASAGGTKRVDVDGGTPDGIFGVLAEAGHSTAAGTYNLKVYLATPESVWLVDTTNTPAVTHMGLAAYITSGGAKIVTNTADTTAELAVVPFEIYRKAADKKVLVRFIDAALGGTHA